MTRESRDGGPGGPTGVERTASDAAFDAVAAAVEEGVFRLDDEGRFVAVNDVVVDLVGYGRAELIGEPLSLLVEGKAEAVESVETALAELRAGEDGRVRDADVPIRTEAGQEVLCELRLAAVEADGAFEGAAGVIRLVSDRPGEAGSLERERARLESELDETLDRVSDAFFAIDAEGRFTYVNERAGELLERDPEALVGADVVEELHGTEDTPFVENALRAHETGEPVTFEEFYSPASRWFRVRLYPGETGVSVYFRDVTEEKCRESVLEQYETVVEAVDDGLYAVDEDYRFAFVNDAYCELTGYDREELIGEHISTVVDEETVEMAEGLREDLRSGERESGVAEVEIVTADGERLTVESKYAVVPDEEEFRGTVGVVRDVSERKAFEEMLAALNEAARKLQATETEDDVGRIVLETVTDVLDLSAATLFRYDEEADEMIPERRTPGAVETCRELPRLPVDDSVTGRVFEDGEFRAYDDVRETPYVTDPQTEMRAGLFAPIGDERVLVIAAPEPGAFDARTERLVEILAGNASAALERQERERELRESERRYRTLVDNFPDGAVALYDEECRYLAVGGQMYDRIDLSRDDAVGRTVEERLSGEIVEPLESMIRRAFEGESEEAEVTYDGRDFWLQSLPIRDEDGDVGLAMVVTRDVTERKRAEEALEENERRFRTMMEQSPLSTQIFDPDGNTLMVNPAWERLWQSDSEDVEGYNILEDEQLEAKGVMPYLEKGFEGEATQVPPVHYDPEEIGKDGRSRWIEAFVYPVFDEDGDIREVVLVHNDITESREQERELRESERRYRTLVDNFPNGSVGLFDSDLRYMIVGGQIYDEIDLAADDVVGMSIEERLPSHLWEELEEPIRGTFRGEANEVEVRAEGRDFWVQTIPLRDDDGDVIAGMIMSQEITERKEYERELAQSEQRYRTLAENIPQGAVGVFDEELRLTLAEGEILDELEGVSAKDLEGLTVHEALDSEIATDLEPAFRGALEGETNKLETTFEGRTFEVWIAPIRDEDGDVFAGSVLAMDATERKERERDFERYERIVENLPVGVYRNTPGADGEFVEGNPQLASIFGADSVDELLEYNVSDLYVDADQRAEFSRTLEREGIVEEFELKQETLDGDTIWISVTAIRVEEDGEVYFDGIVQDVTERKRIQQQLAEERDMFAEGPAVVFRWEIGEDWPVGYVSDNVEEVLGYTPEELESGDVRYLDLLLDEEIDRITREVMENSDGTTERFSHEPYRIKTKDGDVRWVRDATKILRDESGDITGYLGYLVDITERKERERELAEERERYRRLVESAPIAIGTYDDDGRVTFANDAAAELLGADDPEDLIGEAAIEFVHPDEREKTGARMHRVVENREIAEPRETKLVDLDGNEKFAIVAIAPVTREGEPGGQVVLNDITERVQRKDELEDHERALRRTYEVVADPDRSFSEKIDELLQIVREVIGTDYATFSYVHDDQYVFEEIAAPAGVDLQAGDTVPLDQLPNCRHVVETEQTLVIRDVEVDAPELADPTWGIACYLGAPVFAGGEVYGTFCFYGMEARAEEFSDWEVTLVDLLSNWVSYELDRKAYERRLERFRAMIETVNDGVYTVDSEGYISMANAAYAEMTGYHREELIGMHASELVDESIHERAREIEEVLAEGEANTARLVADLKTADDRSVTAEATFALLPGKEEEFERVAVVRDVTQRIERERELERALDLLHHTEDVAEVGGWEVEPETMEVFWTEQLFDILGVPYDEEPPLAEAIDAIYHPEDRQIVEEAIEDALEDGEPFDVEARFVSRGGDEPRWARMQGIPEVEDGEVVSLRGAFHDVTERVERERELERALDLLERTEEIADVGGWEIDMETMDVFWSEQLFDILEVPYDEEPPLEEALEVYHPEDRPIVEEAIDEAISTGEPLDVEARFLTQSDEVRWIRVLGVPEVEGGEVVTLRGAAQDVTERVERERELRERVEQEDVVTEIGTLAIEEPDLERLFDRATDLVAETLDNDLCKLLELQPDGDSLLLRAGTGWDDGLVGETTLGTEDDSIAGRTLQTEEAIVVDDIEAEDPDQRPELLTDHGGRSGVSVIVGSPGDPWGVLGTYDTNVREFTRQDVNFVQSVANILSIAIERASREEELHTRVEQQQVVTDLGKRALEDLDLDALFDEAVERVAETLDNEYAKVLELQPDGDSLLLRSGVGWRDGLVGEGTVGTGDESQAGHTIRSEEPIVVTDLATESRFSGPELLTSHGVVSGVSTIIGPFDDPWGVLGTHDVERREFSQQDVNFVQSVANILATAIDRRTREREIEEQRNQMAAIVRLSEIVQEVDQAVISQSAREEIDRMVCEHLVASGEYAASWIGDVNLASERVVPRAVAGVPDDLVEAVTFDADGEVDDGSPTATAAAAGETEIAREGTDADALPAFARERGYRSMAAVPLAFEDVRYGVLTLFSERGDAFEGYERAILEQLGGTVGHAINAIDRKQALVGDSFTELEIRLPEAVQSFDLSEQADDYAITVEGTVPASDGTVIQYMTVTGLPPEVFQELAGDLPAVDDVRRISGDGPTYRYEVTFSDPPITSTLASYGGRIETVGFDVPDLRVTVALPPTADVRQIVGTLRDDFPDLRIDAQRTVTRDHTSMEEYRSSIEDALTDRQRTALMTAFFAGYFEWSRESTGEEVAETLGVSPSTFHQHLRAAQRKVLSLLFESEPAG